MIDQFTPRFLTTAINEVKAPKSRLMDLVFHRRDESPAEIVDFEIITGNQKLAKFVARGREAVVVDKNGRKVVSFRIPSIREKTPFKAAEFLNRTAVGTSLYQNAGDLQAAAQKMVVQQLAEFKNRFTRTKEQICAQALTGSITITKDDGDLAIDFGVASSHKPVLTLGAKWDAAVDVDIPAQLRAWKRLIARDSPYSATDVILGETAADKFLSNTKVLELLKANNMKAGSLDLTTNSDYIGGFAGLRFWTNEEQYQTDAGVATNYVAAGAVIMFNDSEAFKFWHGPVDDLDANFGTHEFFSKTWREKDPSMDVLLVATAPLPVIHNANALVYATVV